MIKLKFVNGNILVFDVEDWMILRQTHRIVGNIIGSTSFIPSLPSQLLPEEALLLLEKGLAGLYDNDSTCAESEHSCPAFAEALLKAQQQEYREIRRTQLNSVIDKIVENKRKIGDQRSKEDIFAEELEKSSTVTKENMIWPILLQDANQKLIPIAEEVILPLTTPLKRAIFKDLWERGYYITSGQKFGGDFLVYHGDPLVFHAIFIVKCTDSEKTFTPTELIAFGRLGVSVKKRAVLGSIKDGTVAYFTINWIDA